MNKQHRVIWNATLGCHVVTHENAKTKGKPSSTQSAVAPTALLAACIAGLSAFSPGLSAATVTSTTLPTGGQVVAGQAAVSQTGSAMTVQQSSQNAAINWQSFSVGSGATVTFQQPNAASVALNRVLGSDVSVIQGAVRANGQVFLVNPNGVLFTPTAQVNVGGLVASTLNISTDDFMAGKYRFEGSSTASVTNQGNIQGQTVALIAAKVINTGNITATAGQVLVGAGSKVTLDLGGPVKLQVEQGAIDALIEQGGAIRADGGTIYLSAKAAGDLASSVINHTGLLQANSLSTGQGGEIVLQASQIVQGGTVSANSSTAQGGSVRYQADRAMVHTGSTSANGAQGGDISAEVMNLIDAGQWSANGPQSGGRIAIKASGSIEQTAAASLSATGGTQGGAIRLQAAKSLWASGSANASATGNGTGGDVTVAGASITLAGATLSANGAQGGGRIRVGGGWQGQDADIANATSTNISTSSTLSANATGNGNGGTVVVWSEGSTAFGGSIEAQGGAQGGNGGKVEVSSHGKLAFGGKVTTKAPKGAHGMLLLDPKNIIIDDTVAAGFSDIQLTYANPTAGDQFGSGRSTILKNGNIVVVSQYDDTVATDAGAVRLYKADGTLLATLTGTLENSQVGSEGVRQLANGNYVVASPNWSLTKLNQWCYSLEGAVTWGSAETGVSGAVSASNSLVGGAQYSHIGSYGIQTLRNGNYVVLSPFARNLDSASGYSAGAVTWGSGTAGVKGVISASNSLVGTNYNDRVGLYGIDELSNGNYVVRASSWGNNRGAVTWGNGTAGVVGAVSATNSLVGSQSGDYVGENYVTTLANGNYLVLSSRWANGTASNAGAVTFGNGSTGVTGVVSADNSLVGSQVDDRVGNYGITALTNGNYVVASAQWANGTASNAGAVTFGNGSAGVKGAVSASNSLVGSQQDDYVGNRGVTTLTNGNYVVSSASWSNGTVSDVGAVTFGNGSTGVKGVLAASNSLVGSQEGDSVGNNGVTALTNGNYVVVSSDWANGTASGAGAVTFGDGTAGVKGAVTGSNSLVGSQQGDNVGYDGVTTLSNGNYVVTSSNWANGTASSAGAVTFGSGSAGVMGVVSAGNSLVGSQQNDYVGSRGVTQLSNGNYLVTSTDWANGTASSAGAVTFGNGSVGVKGAVSASNSLVGSQTNDRVGGWDGWGITRLANGNYVVVSAYWANGSATSAGAVTFGNGSVGAVGVVSASNSLVGSQAGDQVGNWGVTQLANGNYVVRSGFWANDTASKAGAVTFGSGSAGVKGAVSASNSLVGSQTNDYVGNGGVSTLANGNYVVGSGDWAGGKGAATWANGTTGVVGAVSATNSLVGSTAGDRVGSYVVVAYERGEKELMVLSEGGNTVSNNNYLVLSQNWGAGKGAATWADGSTGITGEISASNSLIGASAGSMSNAYAQAMDGGSFLVTSQGSSSGGGDDSRIAALEFPPAPPGPVATAMNRVDILGPGGLSPNTLYAKGAGTDSRIGVSQITQLLNAGTNVLLQASNDLTLNRDLVSNNATGNGGNLSLQAGRSILLNASIVSDNGNVSLLANDKLSNGVVDADREAGTAVITMASGTRIDAGTGSVRIVMLDGKDPVAEPLSDTLSIATLRAQSKTFTDSGAITLGTVTAGSLELDSVNFNGSITAANKTSDGNSKATVTSQAMAGLVLAANGNLRLQPVDANFADAAVGNGKSVTSSAFRVTGFNGAAAANLTKGGLNVVASTTANITNATSSGITGAIATVTNPPQPVAPNPGPGLRVVGVNGSSGPTASGGPAPDGSTNTPVDPQFNLAGTTQSGTGTSTPSSDTDNAIDPATLAAILKQSEDGAKQVFVVDGGVKKQDFASSN